ncbi:hypothetical protein V2J09_019301 [Rumex salicifolius]
MGSSNLDIKLFLVQVVLVALLFSPAESQGLKVGFYKKSCPNAEAIVKKVIHQVMTVAPSLSGPLLRLHFHDCFVRGCDASILLNSSTNTAEKDAPPNLSLRGYQIIDRVKTALEKACPQTVSCSDIVALVARDVVVETRGISWAVETGRRDGNVSNLVDALTNLVPPTANITTLKSAWQGKGLSVKDLAVLSGGHTIGTSHCSSFTNRLYNFTGKNTTDDFDPTLDSEYVPHLRSKCPQNGADNLAEMDPGSVRTFDQSYYTLVSKRRGLFQSDSALLDDSETKAYVKSHSSGDPTAFFKDFGVSMVNMGRIGVLTGSSGEIRKVVLAALLFGSVESQGLKVGFYKKSCPNAEAIVKKVIHQVMTVAPSLSGPLLRLHFHDCFVRGCDASILLNSSTNTAEKDAPPNLSLRGYQVIDRVKTALEKACPQTVSCSDIVALVARDVVVETRGLSWTVETGRRDGNVSNLVDALTNLVPPTANITTLKSAWKGKGLSVKDLVVLSGGHTIGTSHCSSFTNRLYNFTGKNTAADFDPTLDSNYVPHLRTKCPQNGANNLAEMDPGSARTFDQSYYTLVSKRRGLFQSDSALLDDSETKAYVKSHSSGDPTAFFKDFGVSMVNMGRIGVLTGSSGEIRKVCSKTN